MTRDDMIALAKAKAEAHGLDPALVCAVVEQESGWNPWQCRYEPGFMSRYVAPLYTAGKITATEAYCRSISWGLGQIMGQVARELGFELDTLPELCDPEYGLEYLCRKLSDCMTRAKNDVTAALLRYNGGSRPEYASEVQARIPKYS